jgi:nucleoside-diphosphate-sugar epimerase
VLAPFVSGNRYRAALASALDFVSRDNPFDSSRARRELGWSPPVRPAAGVPEAFQWWRRHR